MTTREDESANLLTYTVLVSAAGEITDIQASHEQAALLANDLKGRKYAQACASLYRPAIKELLNGDRKLLAALMPPPTLGVDAWFAVVGVPLSPYRESGALFIHMDISTWVSNASGQKAAPNKLSMDLVQRAMTTTFLGSAPNSRTSGSNSHLEGLEGLTTRQLEVLKLIGMGKSNVEIAEALSCSLNTIKRHVTAVLQKLKVPNRTRAAMLANKIDLESER